MKYTRIVINRYGGPEALQVVEEECPEPKPDEVRVRVLAAGVALPDVLAREGVHPETPRVPYTPSWDLVGTIDQLGDWRDWLGTAPDNRGHAHPWLLRVVRVLAPTRARPRASGIGPGGGGRPGVELHHCDSMDPVEYAEERHPLVQNPRETKSNKMPRAQSTAELKEEIRHLTDRVAELEEENADLSVGGHRET